MSPSDEQVKAAREWLGCVLINPGACHGHSRACADTTTPGAKWGCDRLADEFVRREASVREECAKICDGPPSLWICGGSACIRSCHTHDATEIRRSGEGGAK